MYCNILYTQGEILTETKSERSKTAWYTSYWILLAILTIIIGIVLPLLLGGVSAKNIVFVVITLLVLGLSYYARVKSSKTTNRFVYIVFLGAFIGALLWLFLLVTRFFEWITNITGLDQDIAIAISLILCFGIGAIIGDLIGKYRNYKGPTKYSL